LQVGYTSPQFTYQNGRGEAAGEFIDITRKVVFERVTQPSSSFTPAVTASPAQRKMTLAQVSAVRRCCLKPWKLGGRYSGIARLAPEHNGNTEDGLTRSGTNALLSVAITMADDVLDGEAETDITLAKRKTATALPLICCAIAVTILLDCQSLYRVLSWRREYSFQTVITGRRVGLPSAVRGLQYCGNSLMTPTSAWLKRRCHRCGIRPQILYPDLNR
jgi:hypothetical protein